MACLLCLAGLLGGLLTGCSSGGSKDTAPHSPVPDGTATPAFDIALSAEEFTFQGIHLHLPDSVIMSDPSNDGVSSMGYTDQPVTMEIWVKIFAGASTDIVQAAETVDASYTPWSALQYYGDGFESRISDSVLERVTLGGTCALIRRYSGADGYVTRAYLFLDSDVVVVHFRDKTGAYTNVIDQSIRSIRIDEELIPDAYRGIMPEGLAAAGLREQVWYIECKPFNSGDNSMSVNVDVAQGVYINMPEAYTPVVADDKSLVWTSASAVLSAKRVDSTLFELTQDTVEQQVKHEGKIEFSKGVFHSMYALQYSYKVPGKDQWVYCLYVQPFAYGEAGVLFTIVSTQETFDLSMFDTLRFADGYYHNGILDVDALAVPAS